MRRVKTAAILLFGVLFSGTAGYALIEGWSLLESLYMTVITVATVGYREVHPMSDAGHWFTIALIFAGVGGIVYSISTLVEFMFEGHLKEMLEGRRMAKRISDMSGHYVVIGLGRVGSVVCTTLQDQGVEFVVVDRCDECIATATERGWPYLQGDATSDEVLEAAGVRSAKGLVTALDTDADNVFVSLTARGMNPSLFIVARSSTLTSESKLLRAGADRVITPTVIGGRRMATSLLNPLVSDYLDIVTHNAEMEYRIEVIRLEVGSPLIGMSLSELRSRDTSGAYVLAISSDGQIDGSPSADKILGRDDELIAFGTRTQLDELAAFL